MTAEAKRRQPKEINLEMDDAYKRFREAILRAEEHLKQLPTPSIQEVEEKMRREQEAVEKMVGELGR